MNNPVLPYPLKITMRFPEPRFVSIRETPLSSYKMNLEEGYATFSTMWLLNTPPFSKETRTQGVSASVGNGICFISYFF